MIIHFIIQICQTKIENELKSNSMILILTVNSGLLILMGVRFALNQKKDS